MGVLDWSLVSSDGVNSSFDDRYDFFQFKQGTFYRIGFAASSNGNIMIIRFDTSPTEIKFRFHSTYTLQPTVAGICKQ